MSAAMAAACVCTSIPLISSLIASICRSIPGRPSLLVQAPPSLLPSATHPLLGAMRPVPLAAMRPVPPGLALGLASGPLHVASGPLQVAPMLLPQPAECRQGHSAGVGGGGGRCDGGVGGGGGDGNGGGGCCSGEVGVGSRGGGVVNDASSGPGVHAATGVCPARLESGELMGMHVERDLLALWLPVASVGASVGPPAGSERKICTTYRPSRPVELWAICSAGAASLAMRSGSEGGPTRGSARGWGGGVG